MTETTELINVNQAAGRGRGSAIWTPDGGEPIELASAENAWTYGYGHIVINLAESAAPNYRPAYIYVEYENVADPDDVVTVPVVDRADGVGYYLGLAGSSSRDFIRIPIVLTSKARDNTSASTQFLEPGLYNQIIFQGLTVGTQGVNGKPFSSAANSKIAGTALVAAPTPSDVTQDLVWSRLYYATNKQFVVPPVGSVSILHSLTFH
jgi:hypothetical protein